MSSKRSPSYRTSNVDHKLACKQAAETVNDQRVSVNFSLRAASEPIVQFPAALNQLRAEGRHEDAEKITNLCKSIATDVDTFTKERDEIDKKFDHVVKNPPRKKHMISDYNAQCTVAGLQYINLNHRIQATAGKSATDFQEIMGKEIADAKEEAVPQQNQAQ